MNSKPILFQGAMVRALLSGAKTQTRRVVKPQPEGEIERGEPGFNHWIDSKYWDRQNQKENRGIGTLGFPCPYGWVGDQLWVREAWSVHPIFDNRAPREIDAPVTYAADNPPASILMGKGRPSIHMPRWLSRITLEITDVRVERLQDISEADAMAEGITVEHGAVVGTNCNGGVHQEETATRYYFEGGNEDGYECAADAYRALWESINGGDSWDENPWVWVVEFKVVNP